MRMNKFRLEANYKEESLVNQIAGTPFHLIKSDENKYLITLGNRIVAEGKDFDELSDNFNKELWNIVWYMGFITIEQIDKLKLEQKEVNNE